MTESSEGQKAGLNKRKLSPWFPTSLSPLAEFVSIPPATPNDQGHTGSRSAVKTSMYRSCLALARLDIVRTAASHDHLLYLLERVFCQAEQCLDKGVMARKTSSSLGRIRAGRIGRRHRPRSARARGK